MRSTIVVTSAVFFVLVLLAVPSPADEEPAAGREMVWDGYLFRDGEGRVRLGWPVVAMGVMSQPAHVVAPPAAKRFAPLVTETGDDYAFWNYDLERAGEGPLKGVPRILVRVSGRVTLAEPDRGDSSLSGGTRTMHEAKLVTVEFLSEEWLRAWAGIFRDRDSPFRIDLDRGEITEAEQKGFALRALGILQAMRAVRGPSEEEAALAKRVDADARVVQAHRVQSQWSVQRWLEQMKSKHGLDLPGLDALPALPPSYVELQRFFLESQTRAAFLAKVKEVYAGELALLELPNYVERGKSTVWVTTDLEEVSRSWTDDEYRTRRDTTQRIVGR